MSKGLISRISQNQSRVLIGAVTSILLCVTTYAWAEDDRTRVSNNPGEFKFSTGFNYTSGDYGDVADTDIWYVPFTLKYQWFPLTAKVTVPYVRINGPGGVVGGGDDVTVVTTRTVVRRTTNSGLGDIVGALTYSIDPFMPAAPLIDLVFKVKFPTASTSRGLGTGEFDYTAMVDLAKTYGSITPLASVGRKFKGSPAGFSLDDVWFASAGGNYKINDHYSGGLIFDWQEPTSNRSDESQELTGYLTWKLSQHWSVVGYGLVGFTDGSPNEGGGLQISFKP